MKIGTLLYTLFRGKLVGKDEFKNRYYRGTGKKLHGRERRWVLYKGKPEASKVPSEWHAWLHHTVEAPLSESAAQAPSWQKDHLPNLTGTSESYLPRGHDRRGGRRAPTSGDYQPWTPQ